MTSSLDFTKMFRFNFWPKPFFPPTGNPGMENSTFVPNLMVLAPTGEGHEAPRLPHPYPGQTMDKDLQNHFNSAPFTMYRPGEHFPPPLYAPMPPFVRPSFERGIGLISPQGGGAFRPLGPSSSENVPDYQSAFTPAKKSKLDEAGTSSYTRTESPDSRTNSPEPKIKDERPSSISSAGYDTNSENLSENGDAYDRGTPDSEGRTLRKQRKKSTLDGQALCCPICGLTLRHSDVESHLHLELEKIDKITRYGRKSRDTTPQGRKNLASPSGCRKGKDSPSPEVISQARFETYLRIRCNRQARLSSRSRNRKKRPGEDGVKETSCPICNEKLTGTSEELNSHVELCLKRRGDLEDEPVDVEGDGDQYEEYTWAGQTRIRATTLLEGGFAKSGFLTSNCRRISQEEDVDLNVDVEDSEEYGTPQYSEADIVPLKSDEPNENQERLALRGAVIGNSSMSYDPGPSNSTSQTTSNSYINNTDSPYSSSQELIDALKAKLKDKEDQQKIKQKCLICMDVYKEPLASIQCWHVHCESCWLQTLGAKKLCPQCNTITSSSDLRRIYL